MKRFLLVSIGILFIQLLFAQIPNGYYDSATGTGYTLKTQLYNIIKSGHVAQDYGDLYDAYVNGDTDPEDGYVWDMYSENPGGNDPYNYEHYVNNCGTYSNEGDCLNREHLFPQGIFSEALPMKTDYHHVVPSDGKVNGMRNNYPFGEVGSASWTSLNGSKLGTCNYSGYSGTVFEPIDEFKGDIARCMLYFATRYEDKVASWSHEMINGTSDQVYEDWFLSLLIEWHNQDPVSSKETTRNEAGYTFQGNRNPFIDHPEYVAQIWSGEGVYISNVSKSPESPTSADVVTVSATITSSGGTVTTANLKWGTSSGTYPNTVSMTSSKGSYSGDISAQTDGTTVYYIIEAEDNNAQSSLSSEYSYTVKDNSSTAIFEEDFETTVVNDPVTINGWSLYNEVGTRSWEGREFETNKYAQMSAYLSAESSNISWLITPSINLSSVSSATFTFISKDAYNNGDPVEVLISTTYSGSGDPNSSSWTDLSPVLATGSTSGYAASFTESGDIDITSYCGNTIYIAYKYTGGDPSLTTTMQIDDVLITGQESTSGVPEITGITNTPVSPSDEDDVTISATITDDGSISLAEIKWGTTSGTYDNSITMTYSGSSDIYSGDIPAQAGGTTIYYVIEATDNDAATNRSDENSYNVAFNKLPEINNVTNSPVAPTEGDDVTVSATITDSDGSISLAEIKWGTTKGTYDNTVTMSYSGADNIYTGTIISQAGGTIINYVIEATDNDSESNRTDEYSFSFNTTGNEVPVITNISIDPTNPESGDPVSVSATITDTDGSSLTAIVKWGLVSGSYPNSVSMINSADTYTADIPAQINETHVYFIVYALDEDGGSAQSEEFDYIVENLNQVPIITNITNSPLVPAEGDDVTVSAIITDSDGTISLAEIKWGTTTGNYPSSVTMTNSGDVYSGAIPAQSGGTIVYYVIKAEDNESGITLSSEFDYTVEGPANQAPVISDVLISPSSPTENDNVTVTAIANDSDGTIISVLLKWKRGTESVTEVPMNFSGGKYYGSILKQSIGETIYFSIIAEDDEGLQGTFDGEYEVSESNGVYRITDNNIQLFPNPTSQVLNINIENYSGLIEIKMYDILGVSVLNKKVDFTGRYKLILEDLDSGIYFIKFDIDNVLITKRIIVKK